MSFFRPELVKSLICHWNIRNFIFVVNFITLINMFFPVNMFNREIFFFCFFYYFWVVINVDYLHLFQIKHCKNYIFSLLKFKVKNKTVPPASFEI